MTHFPSLTWFLVRILHHSVDRGLDIRYFKHVDWGFDIRNTGRAERGRTCNLEHIELPVQ